MDLEGFHREELKFYVLAGVFNFGPHTCSQSFKPPVSINNVLTSWCCCYILMRPAVLQNESHLITDARHKEDKISIYLLIDCISTQGSKSMMVQKQGFPFALHEPDFLLLQCHSFGWISSKLGYAKKKIV